MQSLGKGLGSGKTRRRLGLYLRWLLVLLLPTITNYYHYYLLCHSVQSNSRQKMRFSVIAATRYYPLSAESPLLLTTHYSQLAGGAAFDICLTRIRCCRLHSLYTCMSFIRWRRWSPPTMNIICCWLLDFRRMRRMSGITALLAWGTILRCSRQWRDALMEVKCRVSGYFTCNDFSFFILSFFLLFALVSLRPLA